MIKKTTKYRLLAAILVVCLLIPMFCSAVPSFMALSAENDDSQSNLFDPKDDGNNNSYTITLLVDTDGDGVPDTPYEENMVLKNGTAIRVTTSWLLNDGTTEYELNLGSLSKLTNFDISLKYTYSDVNGHKYEISFTQNDNGEIIMHVAYLEECTCTSRSVDITFEGNVNLDPRDDKGDKNNSFQIGDENIPFTPNYDGSGLGVDKKHGQIEYKDGKFLLKYTVTNIVDGRVTNPIFYDDLPDEVKLVGTPKVTFEKGVESFDGYPGQYPADLDSWIFNEPYDGHSFGITFPDGTVLYDGDIVTYEYTVEIKDPKDIGKFLTSNKMIVNTAYSDCDEKGHGESTNSFPSTSYRKPYIEKSGEKDGDIIKWTITYDTRGLSQLLADLFGFDPNQDVLKQLVAEFGGYDGGGKEKAEEFLISIGIDPTITDTIDGDNHKFADGEKPTFSILDEDLTYEGKGVYTKTITTEITDSNSTKWGNTAEGAGANPGRGSVEPQSEYSYIKSFLSSSNGGSSDELQQRWDIKVTNPYFSTGSKSFIYKQKMEMSFVDKLPDNTEYVEGSAYVLLTTENSEYTAPDWATAGKLAEFYELLSGYLNVTENKDGTIRMDYTVSEEAMSDFRSSLFSFKFDDEHTGSDYLKLTDWNFTIRYDTRIPDEDTFLKAATPNGDGSYSLKLKNTVISGTINDFECGDAEANSSANFKKMLNKTNVYKGDVAEGDKDYKFSKQPVADFSNSVGNGPMNIYFEIYINPDRLTLSENGRLKLIDEMGADISIIPYSIEVTRITNAASGQLSGSPLRPEQYSYDIDDKNNRITFDVPDATYLVLSYWARVTDDGDDIFEAGNRVEIYGWEKVTDSESESPETPLYPSSSTENHTTAFSVYKYYLDDQGVAQPLSGAQFHLEQLTYHPENGKGKEFQLDSSSDPSEWDGAVKTYTDANGEIVSNIFDFTNLPRGAIFRLTETTTPDGFVTKDPIYFIFTNYDDNMVFTNNTVSSEELLSLEDYDIQVFSYYDLVYIENRPKNPTVSFAGSKEIDGREWDSDIDEGAYSFKLTALDGAPMPEEANGSDEYIVKNDMHDIVFPSITYTDDEGAYPRAYHYTIKELAPDSPNPDLHLTYDDSEYDVEVVVAKDVNGSLYIKSVKYTKKGSSERASDTFEFINVYNEPNTGRLSISKKLEGSAPGMRNRRYTFNVVGSEDVAGKTFTVEGATTEHITFSDKAPYTATVTFVGANTATIVGLPHGEYIVTEDIESAKIEGYEHSVIYSPADGKLNVPDNGEAVTITATNNYTAKGDLTLNKVVEGNEDAESKVFTFTITGPEDVDGFYKTADGDRVRFRNGKATVTITGSGSLTIKDLPVGIYTIEEDKEAAKIDDYGLELTYNPSNGRVVVPGNGSVTVTATNKYTDLPGELHLTKKVTGLADKFVTDSKTYTFTIIGPDDVAGKTFALEGARNKIVTFSSTLPATATVKIDGPGTIKIKELPAGEYKVAEVIGDDLQIDDFILTVTVSENGTVMVEKDKTTDVTVTNNYSYDPGDLTIEKIVEGDSTQASREEYTFTITAPEGVDVDGTYELEDGTPVEFKNGMATVKIKANQKVTIKGLPAGEYKVEEINPFNAGNGYTLDTTYNPANGIAKVENGKIGEEVTVTVTNTYTAPGKLTLKKVVEGNPSSRRTMYTFKIIGPPSVAGMSFKSGQTDYIFDENGILNTINKDGTMVPDIQIGISGDGENSTTINNIPVGEYTITEIVNGVQVDGYVLMVDISNDGEAVITAGETTQVDITNTYSKQPESAQLTLSKTVTGSMGDRTKDFKFIVNLKDAIGNPLQDDYPVVFSDGTTDTITFENGQAIIWLSHGQIVTVKDLPYGAQYEIEEVDSAYDTTVTTSGHLNSTNNTKDVEGKSTEGALDGNVTVDYTNKLDLGIPTNATQEFGWLSVMIVLMAAIGCYIVIQHRYKRRGLR